MKTTEANAAVNVLAEGFIDSARRRLGTEPTAQAVAAELRDLYRLFGFGRAAVTVAAVGEAVQVTPAADVDPTFLHFAAGRLTGETGKADFTDYAAATKFKKGGSQSRNYMI